MEEELPAANVVAAADRGRSTASGAGDIGTSMDQAAESGYIINIEKGSAMAKKSTPTSSCS
jgi:hypothetical protein